MQDIQNHISYLREQKRTSVFIGLAFSLLVLVFAVFLAYYIREKFPENIFALNLIWMAPLTMIFLIWLSINIRNRLINQDIDQKTILKEMASEDISIRHFGRNRRYDHVSFRGMQLKVEHKRFAIPRDHRDLIIFHGKHSGIITDILEGGKSLRK